MMTRAASSLTSIVVLLVLTTLPMGTMADVSADVKAGLDADGLLTVRGETTVSGFEAKLVRLAIDSPANLPDFGLLGTGNGDGTVNTTETAAYATKALETGLVKKAFDKNIIKVGQDGKALVASLDQFSLQGAEGNTSDDRSIEVAFDARFQLKLGDDRDTTTISVVLTFSNMSYDIRFSVPDGWDIGEVHGVKGADIVNQDAGSYVKGTGSGDGTPVTVQVKKEGEVCCLFLLLGLIGLIVVIFLLYRRHKRKKEVERALEQPDYHIAPGGSPPQAPVQKEEAVEKRITEEQRTFGKEYHSKGK